MVKSAGLRPYFEAVVEAAWRRLRGPKAAGRRFYNTGTRPGLLEVRRRLSWVRPFARMEGAKC